jgi:hypothetical protein
LDDEQATEALLLQLARYADSQGMTPAWQGVLRDYDVYKLDDGVLILTADERALLADGFTYLVERVRQEAR